MMILSFGERADSTNKKYWHRLLQCANNSFQGSLRDLEVRKSKTINTVQLIRQSPVAVLPWLKC
jgi:hypothetical protein